jgi:hypothetical protein
MENRRLRPHKDCCDACYAYVPFADVGTISRNNNGLILVFIVHCGCCTMLTNLERLRDCQHEYTDEQRESFGRKIESWVKVGMRKKAQSFFIEEVCI